MNPRIGVVETAYHQGPTGAAMPVETRFSRILSSNEQPYIRHCVGSEAWAPLDTGWLKECSLLVVQNTGDVPLELCSSPACNSPTADWLVLPGESMRGMPKELARLRVKGSTRFTVSVFPK